MKQRLVPEFPDIHLDILASVTLPEVYEIHLTHMMMPPLKEIRETVWAELDRSSRFRALGKGSSVAVAVGSRGIGGIVEIVASSVSWLKERGFSPFIIPAMGSHGGATGEGQEAVLHSLGITEEAVGTYIKSSMDVCELGMTDAGIPCCFSKDAYEADAVLVINRVKSHTSFPRDIESGLTKLVAVGLGKAKGARNVHKIGPVGLRDSIPKLAEIAISSAPIAYGLALVENSQHEIFKIVGAEPQEFYQTDKHLLVTAKAQLATLPFRQIDVLVVEKIGKDISGMGMDYSVIGRTDIRGIPNPESPFIHKIVALTLTAASEGNAQGMGVADFIPKRMIREVDLEASYMNAITASVIEKVRIPPVMPTDRDAIKAALATSWRLHENEIRFCVIESTLHLDRIYVSRALAEEAAGLSGISISDAAEELAFSEDGSLLVNWRK